MQSDAVAQHPVVEQNRRIVEHDDIDVVRAERHHESRRELRSIPPVAVVGARFVDADRDIDIAVRPSPTPGVGPEEVRLENLLSLGQNVRKPSDELPVRALLHHPPILWHRIRGSKIAFPGTERRAALAVPGRQERVHWPTGPAPGPNGIDPGYIRMRLGVFHRTLVVPAARNHGRLPPCVRMLGWPCVGSCDDPCEGR